MTLNSQVKVFTADVASFAGLKLRRLTALVGGQRLHLLLHEQGRSTAFVVADAHASSTPVRPLFLQAEWGEPLGAVQAVQTDADTGEVTAYRVALKLRTGEVQEAEVQAHGTFWWNGELCCTKRVAYALRDQQKGRRKVRQDAA